MRMPRPPPPAVALRMTGKPICRDHSRASSSEATTPSEPGRIGTPCCFMAARAFSFSPISRMTSGVGPMNLMWQVSQTSAKLAFFRKQAVTGMDGVHIGDFGGADHRGNVEITQRQLRRANANRLIGKAHMQRIAVRFTVDCDGADAELLACANDAQRNLAAIRYQNLLEH